MTRERELKRLGVEVRLGAGGAAGGRRGRHDRRRAHRSEDGALGGGRRRPRPRAGGSAPRRIAPGASLCSRTSRFPAIPRSSSSATRRIWRRRQAAAGRRAGGDAAGNLRGQACGAVAAASPQPKPFHYVDKGNLATIGRRLRHRGFRLAATHRLRRLVLWAGGPHLLPHQLPQPPAGDHAVGLGVPDGAAWRAAHHAD